MPQPIRRKIPPELLAELADALSFDVRWGAVRVSAAFDYFVVKKQFKWIKNELARQEILRKERTRLSQAIGRINWVAGRIRQLRLIPIRNLLAAFFRVPNNVGLSELEDPSQLTAEMFTRQFAVMTERIDRENIETVRYNARVLQSVYDIGYGYTGEPGAPFCTSPSSDVWGVGRRASSDPLHPASS
uniref:Uncharacterized protein n=1 Tax=Globodera rostochiensis TaxID=31243 RepID=A0A914HL51_GLORO